MLSALFNRKKGSNLVETSQPEVELVTRQGFICHHQPKSKIQANLQELCDRSYQQGVTNLLLQNKDYALHIAEGPQLAVQDIISSTLPRSKPHRHGFLFSSHVDQERFFTRPLVWVAHAQNIAPDQEDDLGSLLDRFHYGRNENAPIARPDLGFLLSLEMYSWIPPQPL